MLNVLFRVEMSMCLQQESAGRERERVCVCVCVPFSCWLVCLAARKWGWEDEGAILSLLYCPGRSEWHQSFSLDEVYKFVTPTAKTIPALNNNLKFSLSATPISPCLQLIWIQNFISRPVAVPTLKSPICSTSSRENSWIHTWNANSLVQYLNPSCRVHFLWR